MTRNAYRNPWVNEIDVSFAHTARETLDCGNFACGCVDHHCSGGFCPGTGCTAHQTQVCSAKSCGCANGACTGAGPSCK